MAAKGIFTGLTLVQVQAIQASAVESLTSGKVKTSWSADGVSADYTIPAGMSPTDILEECAYAINYLNGTLGARRVHPSFRRGYSSNLAVD